MPKTLCIPKAMTINPLGFSARNVVIRSKFGKSISLQTIQNEMKRRISDSRSGHTFVTKLKKLPYPALPLSELKIHIDICKNIIPPSLKSFGRNDKVEHDDNEIISSLNIIYDCLKGYRSNIKNFNEFLENEEMQNIINNLKYLIESNIFRKRDQISNVQYFNIAELQIDSPFDHIHELEMIYNILFELIRILPEHHFTSWINPTFIRKLIKLLETPDTAEQITIVNILREITVISSNTLNFILSEIIKGLIDFNDGNLRFYFVSGSLKLLKIILKSNDMFELLFNKNYTNLVIYPLFKSEFLHLFYNDLNGLIHLIMAAELQMTVKNNNCFFEEYSSNRNEKGTLINYLLQHWPITNSRKEYSFIHQILSLVVFQSPAAITPNQFLAISEKLKNCVGNIKMNTAISTMKFINNYDFLKKLLQISPLLLQSILLGVEFSINSPISDSHDGKELVNIAQNLKNSIHFISPSIHKYSFSETCTIRENDQTGLKLSKNPEKNRNSHQDKWDLIKKMPESF